MIDSTIWKQVNETIQFPFSLEEAIAFSSQETLHTFMLLDKLDNSLACHVVALNSTFNE